MNMAIRPAYLTLILLLAFAGGFAANQYLFTDAAEPAAPGNATAPEAIAATASRYVCPMHAHIQGEEPGHCPICGMDLVPVAAPTAAAADDHGQASVRIRPDMINNLGIRTSSVKRGTLSRQIDTMGNISQIRSTRNVDVTPELPGRLEWIAELHTGDIVNQGDVLYRVFSPERIQAQQEYLESWKQQDHKLLQPMWDALRALQFTDMDIKRLEETQQVEELYAVVSPQTGAVIRQAGVVGNRVQADSRVFTIGGNYRVDLNAEVFEQQWGLVAFRQRADISIPSIPGGRFQGIVQTINNTVNYKTRSLTANLAFATLNPNLREGMVADVTIHAEPRENVLYVPRDAVIRNADEARVVIVAGEGQFRPVRVTTGIETGNAIEILDGLEEDQEIVVSGQFLIDSESSLTASFRRMGE
jgi:Cu(I)/Ag(I) efflux system membrane fusion protein